jgi:hypothetical protein
MLKHHALHCNFAVVYNSPPTVVAPWILVYFWKLFCYLKKGACLPFLFFVRSYYKYSKRPNRLVVVGVFFYQGILGKIREIIYCYQ